ncbi:MAG: BrnT family toxin [Sphingomonas sp.]
MFDFDPAKSAANKAKHGIDFEEAQALWLDANRLELPSRDGGTEERWLVIGRIDAKLWTAVVTYRQSATRLISCRRARRDEERLYDED